MLQSAWEDLRNGDLREVLDSIEDEVLTLLAEEFFGTDAKIEWTGFDNHEDDIERYERYEREYIIDSGGRLFIGGWLAIERNKENKEPRIYFWGGVFLKCLNGGKDKNLTEGELLQLEFNVDTKEWELWC